MDSNFSDAAVPSKPVRIKWDGETQKKVVKQQLMYFVNDTLRKDALTMNSMDFHDAFVQYAIFDELVYG